MSNKEELSVWDFSKEFPDRSNSDSSLGMAIFGASDSFCCFQCLIIADSHSYCDFKTVGFLGL